MTTSEPITAIRKELILPIAPDRAFQLFTADLASWWPLATHSVGGEDAVGVSIDGRVGGLVAEATSRGERHVWGTVRLWDPPRRIVLDWHPGRPATEPTELEVRFEPWESGARLVLEHRGWERVSWSADHAGYETGWDGVLGRFVAAAA